MVSCNNPKCLGNYDFNHIADFAIKRFVDGQATIDLMTRAKSDIEKAEIALVSLLDVEDCKMVDMHLCCEHQGSCKAADCRERLKQLIESELIKRDSHSHCG